MEFTTIYHDPNEEMEERYQNVFVFYRNAIKRDAFNFMQNPEMLNLPDDIQHLYGFFFS
jgi:hypothetical protein